LSKRQVKVHYLYIPLFHKGKINVNLTISYILYNILYYILYIYIYILYSKSKNIY